MTQQRNPATAPIFRAFSELSALPPAERRESLMLRLEHVWNEAQGKTYTNKHGDAVPNPDGNLQLKVIQAVAALQGLTGETAPGQIDVEESDRIKLAALRSLCSDSAVFGAVLTAGSLLPLFTRFMREMAAMDSEQRDAAALMAPGENIG